MASSETPNLGKFTLGRSVNFCPNFSTGKRLKKEGNRSYTDRTGGVVDARVALLLYFYSHTSWRIVLLTALLHYFVRPNDPQLGFLPCEKPKPKPRPNLIVLHHDRARKRERMLLVVSTRDVSLGLYSSIAFQT